MKHKKIVIGVLGVLLLAGAFCTGHYAGATSKTPGSTGDPLITLSYLEGRLEAQTGGYKKVRLNKGETLLGGEGTGIVVLGGSVIATGGGLIDLTGGTLTEEDTSMFLYHNYVAAEENVGCEALAACTLLVTGEYTIE